MSQKNNSLEILKDFVVRYEADESAPVVQGVFKEGVGRDKNILYSPSFQVTKEHQPYLESFLSLMLRTMIAESGIGIASCQVGVPLQAFIIGMENDEGSERYLEVEKVPYQVFINPRIIKASKQYRSFWHGCLSAKGQKLGRVATYDWVECEAYTLDFKKFRVKLEGMASIIFQHEFRHLLGKLYIDQTHKMKYLYISYLLILLLFLDSII